VTVLKKVCDMVYRMGPQRLVFYRNLLNLRFLFKNQKKLKLSPVFKWLDISDPKIKILPFGKWGSRGMMPTIWPKPDILKLSVHGDFVLRHNYLKLNISNKLHILVF